jgi:tyrosine-protein kinase Etk/Wzc
MHDQGELGSRRSYRDRLANISGEFDAGLFIHIVRKSLPWLALCVLLSAVAAFLNLRYTPLVYESRAIIQLAEDDNVNRILNVESYIEEGQVESRLEQLRSKLLIGRTLQRLPMRISYFAKGQILTSEHYSFSPYKIELTELENPALQDVPVIIRFSGPTAFHLIYNENTYGPFRDEEPSRTPDFTIRVRVENPIELMRNEDEYELFFRINSLQSLTSRFYQGLDVRILNSTAKTIEVSYRDNNPYLARDFVREHSGEFIAYDLEKRQKSDDNVLAFLDNQIDTVFDRLRESEVKLNTYKQQNRITDLDEVGSAYLERLNNYEAQSTGLMLEERLLEEVEKLTRRNATEIEVYNLIPLIAGSQYESSLSKLLEKLYVLLSDKQVALYSVTPESEKARSLNYQIDVQKSIILQSVSALREQIRNRRSEIDTRIEEVEGTYYRIPQKELEYARLQRLFSINEKYYTLLLEKAIEYRISKEGFVSNNQILEEARVPSGPISPRRSMVWISFLLIGFIAGLILIAVRYFLHNHLTSLHDVVRLSDAALPSLGIVPRFRSPIPVSMLLVDKNPRSILAEAFRTIRTNLQFLRAHSGPSVISITSTISGEGKTFVAINLAGIIAFGGKRVVVVDLDMRKPKIHRGFGVENKEGMSTLLVGRNQLDEVIRRSQMENLDFITAGPTPPNPSELILMPRMQEILGELRRRYDAVILDTPPVGLVTDAVPLMRSADFPIYVFRADYSQRQFVQVADRLVNESGIPVSIVLNAVDLERARYSRRYSYGYGYGTGYGNEEGYYQEDAHRGPVRWWKRLFRRIR